MFIKDFYNVSKKKGEVGIEIEVEGYNLPSDIAFWDRVEDGSLRGESAEYVIRNPCSRTLIRNRLSKIYNAYIDHGTKVVPSPRQSVHIHINVQDLTVSQIYSFILTFIIFEELLVNFCGDGRTGNLFCLRARDAEYLMDRLSECSNVNSFTNLCSNELRYSAVNVASLAKYGSLEFRSMRGGTDQKTLETWIHILLAIKDYSVFIKDPKELAKDFREKSIEDFTRDIFGDLSPILLNQDYDRSIREGARLIKMTAYSGDWERLSTPYEEMKKEKPLVVEFLNSRDNAGDVFDGFIFPDDF